MNLEESIKSIFELYGPRNAMYLRGEARAFFLHERIREFCKRIRNNDLNKGVLAEILASIFARTLAYADSFIDLPLVEALCLKYPSFGCAYCGEMPCDCGAARLGKAEIAVTVSPEQLGWTVRRWIEHMGAVYGAKNKERGINFMLLRFIEEVHESEAAHLFDAIADPDVTLHVRRENLAREFADAFAWIFSIAFVMELDLQTAIERRYGGVCFSCNKRPCNCPSPFVKCKRSNPVDDHRSADSFSV